MAENSDCVGKVRQVVLLATGASADLGVTLLGTALRQMPPILSTFLGNYRDHSLHALRLRSGTGRAKASLRVKWVCDEVE